MPTRTPPSSTAPRSADRTDHLFDPPQPQEVAELQALAEAAELPASTLVRSWIIEAIRAEHGGISDAEAELRAAQRHLVQLQQHLSQHAS